MTKPSRRRRPYFFARESIAAGDLLLFAGRDLFSRVIRCRTASRVTHVGLAVRFAGRVAVLEAVKGRGVELNPLSRYVKRGDVIHWARLTRRKGFNPDDAVAWGLRKWGQPYAHLRQFWRSWGMLWGPIAKRLGVPPDHHAERYFCSELVAECLWRAGVRDELLAIPARVSPGDFLELPGLHQMGRISKGD